MAEGRITVGNVEIIGLTDSEGDFPFALSALFPSVQASDWEPFRQRYPEVFRGLDTWYNHYGCYLVRSEGRTILVDTGVGSRATNPGIAPMLQEGDGRLPFELVAHGIRPDDVDTVFFTHLHIDHVGWNLSQYGPDPKAAFPRARYLAHRADWEHFQRPEQQEPFKYWDETLGPLKTLGIIDLLDGERVLTGEVTAIPNPGHTPGHMVLVIASQGEHAVIMGDAAIHPAQITELDWGVIFEWDQGRAAQSRRDLFDKVEADNATLVACHFPTPGFGKLVRAEGRRYWQSL